MSFVGAELDPAFILHARHYQETSQLLEVLSAHHGRVGLVARGSRRPSSRWRSVLQPFQPLRLSWGGRGSLATLRAAEPAGWCPPLAGMALMGAFYLNELLLNFLRRGDAHPELFAAYAGALDELRACAQADVPLRRFELRLLATAGYGLNLSHDASTESPLDPRAPYEFRLEQGPVPAMDAEAALVFSGAQLLAIGRGDLDDPAVLASARRLLRAVLAHHLSGRELRTRRVAEAMRR